MVTILGLRRLGRSVATAGLVIALAGCSQTGPQSAPSVESLRVEKDVTGLIEALSRDDEYERRDAAIALGELEATAAVPALAGVVESDPVDMTRQAATEALGAIGDPRGRAALIAALGGDVNANVRSAAAVALASTGSSADTAHALGVAAVSDADRQVRSSSIDSLGSLEGPEASSALMDIVESPAPADTLFDSGVDAAEALAERADPSTMDRMLVAWTSADRFSVLETALEKAIAALGAAPVPNLLYVVMTTADNDLRSSASDVLIAIGGPSVGNVTTAFIDLTSAVDICSDCPEQPAAYALIGVLRKIGEPAAEPAYLAGLSDSGIWRPSSLGMAGIYRDRPADLVAFLDSPDTVRVYLGLLRLGDASTVDALVATLQRSDDVTMAEDYLNCGNGQLEAAASDWAAAHGYEVITTPGIADETWGTGLD